MRNDPPAGSVQAMARPVYCADPGRDYVPPPIFSLVRAPQPIPRNDLKDQDAHRRGAVFPAEAPAPETTAPAPAPTGAMPTNWLNRGGYHRQRGTPSRDLVRAVLRSLPPGAALTVDALRRQLPSYLGIEATRHALQRMRRDGEAETRALLRVGSADQAGHMGEWRLVQAAPWGEPPPHTCLPGQRPRQRIVPTRPGAAA